MCNTIIILWSTENRCASITSAMLAISVTVDRNRGRRRHVYQPTVCELKNGHLSLPMKFFRFTVLAAFLCVTIAWCGAGHHGPGHGHHGHGHRGGMHSRINSHAPGNHDRHHEGGGAKNSLGRSNHQYTAHPQQHRVAAHGKKKGHAGNSKTYHGSTEAVTSNVWWDAFAHDNRKLTSMRHTIVYIKINTGQTFVHSLYCEKNNA